MLAVGYLSVLFSLFILVLGNHCHSSHIGCNNTVIVFGFDERREKLVIRHHFILFLQFLPFFPFFTMRMDQVTLIFYLKLLQEG